ncbi:hypothetical protein FRX31_031650 [Thalictrum thalictroides]|uniref:CLAVATA3/ESR (CLE)-related protein n=1 Tax=Thalictrum thalictroides TaxID=46969 RepID=A0A7J6V1R0_THATH|nr:hypothetical protein FRX31_031650 [Thalictrum thalictroides]
MRMRHKMMKRLQLLVFLVWWLFNVKMLFALSTSIQSSPVVHDYYWRFRSNSNNIPNSFNYRRFQNHAARDLRTKDGNHDVEEQKRSTPFGANPLHNL